MVRASSDRGVIKGDGFIVPLVGGDASAAWGQPSPITLSPFGGNGKGGVSMNGDGIVLGEKIRPNGGEVLEGFVPEDWEVHGLRDGTCMATHWGRGVKFVVQLDELGYSARMIVEVENIDLGFAEVEKLGCEAMTAALLNTNAPDWGPSPFGIRTQLN